MIPEEIDTRRFSVFVYGYHEEEYLLEHSTSISSLELSAV
jgi:hypothetical protein